MKQKKLMILGGSRYILPIIERAHKMGVHVITCDYLPDNIAHKYADEYCNASVVDKEEVLSKAKKLKIDGIMSFACDPGVTTAAYVAEKLSLPSVGSYEAVSILQDKGLFRKFLADNGFNVPNAKRYEDCKKPLDDIDYFNWPVIVKPTDSAGSKGVTRVDNPKDLEKAIRIAKKQSHNEAFIIEDFLLQDGYSSDCDCFSIDGKMVFYSFDAQRFDKKAENPYTPSAYSWPTTINDKNQQILKDELQRLVTLLDLKTSVYNVETRQCRDGKPYIMEFSPRGGGNRLSEMVNIGAGVDLLDGAIKAALGMEIDNIKQRDFDCLLGEVILHSNKPGIFKEIRVKDNIKNMVIESDLWVKAGDKIGSFKGANEAIGTLVLKFETLKELEDTLTNIDSWLTIEVGGNNI